jgi:hypothetical protein
MKPTTMIAVLLLVACGDNELSRVDVEVFYPLAVADVLATMQVGSVLVAPKEGSCADAPQQAATISTGEPLAVANTNIRLPAAGFEGGEACLGTRMSPNLRARWSSCSPTKRCWNLSPRKVRPCRAPPQSEDAVQRLTSLGLATQVLGCSPRAAEPSWRCRRSLPVQPLPVASR